MRIEVSQLPPVEYSPNWRGSWFDRYQSGLVYRNAVYYSCVEARNRAALSGYPKPFDKARLDLTFVFPQRRRRDQDNLQARFKPGQDAIVAAGLVRDDDAEHLVIGRLDIVVDPKRAPITIIELKEERDNSKE